MFDFSALRRFPDVEAPNLQAWDATDELLVEWALAAAAPGDQIAVIGDEYGAITLALADAGLEGIRVHQDLVTGRRALTNNAEAMGLSGWTSHELDETLLVGARVVLVQLPKSLAALAEISDAVARWAASDVVLVAGGRVKHMTLTQNDVLARSFEVVQPQRAARKSRLLVASDPRPAGAASAPESSTHTVAGLEFVLCAYGGAFAGAKLDIGTRALLDAMPALAAGSSALAPHSPAESPAAASPTAAYRSQLRKNPGQSGETGRSDGLNPQFSGVVNTGLRVIDLGCGTGALAVAFALQHPTATVIATDRSAAAVRSARATVDANRLQDRIAVTLDDAGSDLDDASADLILLNPPFHLGASVHEGAGQRLIQAAARLTREGGEVWTVFNSHLDHRRTLTREVGPTEQIARTPKFTVTRTIKRR